jgi:hypothetical protein
MNGNVNQNVPFVFSGDGTPGFRIGKKRNRSDAADRYRHDVS